MPNCCYVILAATLFFSTNAHTQTFVKITDTNNPIVADSGPGGYTGASWIDFDGDRDLDLFVNNGTLYRNDGNGIFVKRTTAIGSGVAPATGNGHSWADYDNDGDLDVYISSRLSVLYRNDGNEVFTRITAGDIGDGSGNRGWSCAWADYDNDGFVDLAITHPAGFVPPTSATLNNHLLLNDGAPDFTFTKITTEPIVSGPRTAYTVGTWSDFDQDGDMDYFVGAGPANGSTQADFLYRNLLVESGAATFERISDSPLATDRQDGQIWNWIDYDNDGDLDAYLTNWGGPAGGIANRLYRNDGGTFTRITTGAIVTDTRISLSSVWGDFDNDGDLDCYVANDNNQPDNYYENNGDGSFNRITSIALVESITRRGATAGDYDNDGDLDMFVVGPGSGKALYRNDTNNGNTWLNVTCVGTVSNKAAIGAKVRAKAVINGQSVWQMREILAQNTFNGHNSLRAHFGLGDATTIDTLRIEWPSGIMEEMTGIQPNVFMTVTERDETTSVDDERPVLPGRFALGQNYPNPFNPSTSIEFSLPTASEISLKIYNMLGQETRSLISGRQNAGVHTVVWDGKDDSGAPVAGGIYIYKMVAGAFVQSNKMILLK